MKSVIGCAAIGMLMAASTAWGQAVAHWAMRDGTGSSSVKDAGEAKLTGRINDPVRCMWAREDDRGFFLNFNGGAVVVPNHKDLTYPDGFILDVRFSCDLEKIAATQFASLVTKGDTFQDGISVMVRKNGDLLINPKGLVPTYKLVALGLKRNTDYQLKVAAGDGHVYVYLDGKLVERYAVNGTLDATQGDLHIGSIEKYPYFGNIYDVKLAPFDEKALPSGDVAVQESAPKKNAPVEHTPQKIVDPAGMVLVADFAKFAPQPIIGGFGSDPVLWRFRSDAPFMRQSGGVLHPPLDIAQPPLTYDPKLKGKFDVYVGVRAIGATTTLQLRLDDTPDYYTIRTDPIEAHRDIEVLVDRDVAMDGKQIELASAGLFYLGYLKFVPAEQRRSQADEVVPDPLASVTRRSRITNRELDAVAQKDIDEKIKSGYFIERTYVEKRPEPEATNASQERGYILFNQNWMDLLFPVNVPEKDPGEIALKVAAAAGEYEPITFGVRALQDIESLTIRQVAPFKSADGVEEKVDMQLAVVGSATKRTTNFTNSSEFIVGPQYLEQVQTLHLKKGMSGQFWITLQVADDTAPGIYTSSIELSNGEKTQKIPIELKVYPFKLDPAVGYDIGFCAYLSNKEEARVSMKQMAQYGMTFVLVYGEQMLTIRGKTLEDLAIDFDESTLPVVAQAYKEYGMTGNLVLTTKPLMDRILRLPADQQDKAYEKLIMQIENHAKEQGWPKIYYFSYDEVLSEPSLLPLFIREVKLQKKLGLSTANDHIWYKTSRPFQKEVDEIADYNDIFINRFNTRRLWYVDTWDEMVAEAGRRGKKVYAYNSNNALVFAQPAAMRYASGWFFRDVGNGATGQMTWVYYSPRQNPYNDLDGSCADWIYYYPAYEGRKGGPAIDLEAHREGVDDLRYILTLENLITQAQGKGIDVSMAQEALAGLLKRFDREGFYTKSVFLDSKWDEVWEDADGKRYAAGRFNLPNGWMLEDYDSARRQIAEAIIELQNRLNGEAEQ